MTQDAKASRAIEGSESEAAPSRKFLALMLGSIGVVYGDIGTSPLYAFRESVLAATGHNAAAGREAILGILSLIIWALLLIVTVKYVIVLLRADNNGEGGTLALMALAHRALGGKSFTIILLGMISAALFYGDAMITPALSVLSAVEGLEVIAPAFERFVVPLSVLILFALFAVQSRGTARVAAFFGPITLVWFIVLAIEGAWHIAQNLTVLAAFNPLHGVSFLLSHGYIGLLTLGAVFLVVTGAEALYAASAISAGARLGGLVMVVMLTWRRGARILAAKTRRLEMPIESLIQTLDKKQPFKVLGTAVFLTADPSSAPTALLHSLKHSKVLHEQNVVLTIITEPTPRVAPADRITLEPLGKIFARILIRFGFMETPNIPKALALARKRGLNFDIMLTSFFLSRRSVRPDPKSGMPVWQDRLFIILAKNADEASSYFQLPTDRVVEIGTQVTV
jgi:K+ transporter